MPAQRLPWIKFWPEALDHEKFAELTDSEAWTWVVVWAKASQQPKRWRFASRVHASTVTGRPLKYIAKLVRVGLLDETAEGVVVHDAAQWQEASSISKALREGWPNGGRRVTEVPAKGDGTVILEPANSDLEGEGDKEEDEDVKTENPPSPPRGKRAKPARDVLTQVERTDLIVKWQERYGGMANVADEIDVALNHTARLKHKSERIYVDHWLSKELHWRPTRNGHAKTAVNIAVADDCARCGRQNIMLAYHQCDDDEAEG